VCELVLLCRERGLQLLFQPVGGGAGVSPLFQRQTGKAAEHKRETAAPAKVGDAPGLERLVASDGRELAQRLRFYLRKRFVHRL